MSNELDLYGSKSAEIVQKSGNYIINGVMGGIEQKLKRGVDFGVIPRTKQPSLFKSGAEKICQAFGLLVRYRIQSSIEQFEPTPFFFYNVECQLIKINPMDGKEYVFATSFGSANTSEKRNGFNGACDAANSTLKMAQKRALVGAAITIGGISDMFTQDMDNENFMNGAQEIYDSTDPDSPISAKQTKRIFALAADNGLNAEQAKQKLIAMGFESTKSVTQKDYDKVCEAFSKGGIVEEKKTKEKK